MIHLSKETRDKFESFLRRSPQRLAKQQAGLPANIDECMGYFTGYRKTRLAAPRDVDSFIDLAKRCVEYCRKMNDRETLHLLFYSVLKRVGSRYGTNRSDLVCLWDLVTFDVAGLYNENRDIQVQDMSKVFNAYLLCLKSDTKYVWGSDLFEEADAAGLIDFMNHCDYINLDKLTPWQDINAPNANCKKLPLTWPQSVEKYFHRGGGLYHFIDTLKRLSPGTKDDNSDWQGVYVTPGVEMDGAGIERDYFYAARCRAHGDKPSYQSGHVSGKNLFRPNHNAYEGFIAAEALVALKSKVKIHVLSPSFEDDPGFRTKEGLSLELKEYVPDDGFKSRVQMIYDVVNARGTRQQIELKSHGKKVFTVAARRDKYERLCAFLEDFYGVINRINGATRSAPEQKYVDLSNKMIAEIKTRTDINQPFCNMNEDVLRILDNYLPQLHDAPRWYQKTANMLLKLANFFRGSDKQVGLFRQSPYKTIEEIHHALKYEANSGEHPIQAASLLP